MRGTRRYKTPTTVSPNQPPRPKVRWTTSPRCPRRSPGHNPHRRSAARMVPHTSTRAKHASARGRWGARTRARRAADAAVRTMRTMKTHAPRFTATAPPITTEPPPGEPGHEGGDPAREHAVLPGEEVLAPDPGSDQGGGHLGSGPHDRHRPPPQRRHVGRGEEGKRLVGALGEEGSGPEEKEREDGKAHSHGGPREPAPVGEGEGAAQRPPLCFGR